MRIKGKIAITSPDLLRLNPHAPHVDPVRLLTKRQFSELSECRSEPPDDVPLTRRPERCRRSIISAKLRAKPG